MGRSVDIGHRGFTGDRDPKYGQVLGRRKRLDQDRFDRGPDQLEIYGKVRPRLECMGFGGAVRRKREAGPEIRDQGTGTSEAGCEPLTEDLAELSRSHSGAAFKHSIEMTLIGEA